MSNIATYSWCIVQGEVGYLEVAYQDADGAPISLAGYSPLLTIWVSRNGRLLRQYSEGDGLAVNVAEGEIVAELPANETAHFADSMNGYYELVLDSPSAPVILLRGQVKVTDTRTWEAV